MELLLARNQNKDKCEAPAKKAPQAVLTPYQNTRRLTEDKGTLLRHASLAHSFQCVQTMVLALRKEKVEMHSGGKLFKPWQSGSGERREELGQSLALPGHTPLTKHESIAGFIDN